jgi:hypothetical protein
MIFHSLFFDLESQRRLKASKTIRVIEKVGMFLYTSTLGASNREI